MLSKHFRPNPYLRAAFFGKYYRRITPEITKEFYHLEKNYENNPTDIMTAYRYFKELNRLGHTKTVMRLYNHYLYDYEAIKGKDAEKLKD
jgi:hypothetical protein